MEPALGCKHDAEFTPRCNHVYSCFVPRVQGTVCGSCWEPEGRQQCTTSTAPQGDVEQAQQSLGLQEIVADMTKEYSRVGHTTYSRVALRQEEDRL